MTPEQWSQIKHFTPKENWGDPERMNFELLKGLDALRAAAGTRILVTCGTQGTHTAESEHYKGNAVDIVFPNLFLPRLFDMFILATRFNVFTGIGIYPHWKVGGVVHGGLHLDARAGDRCAYWMGVPGDLGQRYLPLTAENLVKYGLIG